MGLLKKLRDLLAHANTQVLGEKLSPMAKSLYGDTPKPSITEANEIAEWIGGQGESPRVARTLTEQEIAKPAEALSFSERLSPPTTAPHADAPGVKQVKPSSHFVRGEGFVDMTTMTGLGTNER